MLLSVLALSAALAPVNPGSRAQSFVVDCQVAGETLTDCRITDPILAADGRAPDVLKLAAQVRLPEALALSHAGRMQIRLSLQP